MFNKKLISNMDSGAQNLTVLCLCFIALVIVIAPQSVQAQASIYNNGDAAQTEIRLQQMETQIRELTGKVEEQLYEINSLKQKIDMLEKMSIEPERPAPTASPTMTPQQSSLPIVKEPSGMNVVTPKPAPQPEVTAPETNSAALDLEFKPAIQQETPLTGGEAAAQYEAAYTQVRMRQFDGARTGFENFLKNYSDNILAANAHYWLGETYYVQGEYGEAARAFAKGFQAFPDSAKSPDMLLKLGMSLKGMNKKGQACVALSQLPIKFPGGPQPVLDLGEKQMRDLECGENNE